MKHTIFCIQACMICAWTIGMGAGCEAKIEDEGAVSLAELQGIVVEPYPAPASPTPSPAPSPAPAPAPSVSITGGAGIGPQGQGGGFVWKPIGENSKKLVVLLPPRYTGQVAGVYIASASGAVLEGGNYTGVGNGGREHYRFSKPGSGYGRGIKTVAKLKAGGSVHWPIPNGASRVEY